MEEKEEGRTAPTLQRGGSGYSMERALASRLGSPEAARAALERAAEELGVPPDSGRALVAVALVQAGADLDQVARALTWDEFEDFCARAMGAAGYVARSNVVLRRPRRQIDIVAESPSMLLSVDCKHWKRAAGPAGLERLAAAQVERTRNYKAQNNERRAILPLLITLLESPIQAAGGVPVVPVFALRGFLASVSRFDEGLLFV